MATLAARQVEHHHFGLTTLRRAAPVATAGERVRTFAAPPAPAASPRQAALLIRWARACMRAWCARKAAGRTRRALRRLDDRLLDDIGVLRADIGREADTVARSLSPGA